MKIKLILVPAISAIILTALAFVMALTFISRSSSSLAVIKDRNNDYYAAKNLLIIGNTVILSKNDQTFKFRNKALESKDLPVSLTKISLLDIASIEFIHEEKADTGQNLIPANYLGLYKVNVTGHPGFLFIREEKGILYGYLRFPQWGKGAYEYLKGLRIINNEIQFVRSATTVDEIRRIGANATFIQRYTGTYSPGGKEIKGFYVNDRGDKNLWDAKR